MDDLTAGVNLADVAAVASLLCVAAGLVAATLALAVTRQPRVALPVFLDFLLAAGLLRLTHDSGTAALLIAAVVLVVRVLVLVGLGRPSSRPSAPPG